MQLFIYASSSDINDRQMTNKITDKIGTSIEQFDSLRELTQYLRTPISASMVAILWPRNRKELAILIERRHLLRNMRIILILPDREKHTISQSHILRPRYVSHADGNMSDVLAVIGKMAQMEKNDQREAV